MSELSIFIDESGDFGTVNNCSPYYLVSMLFHEQAKGIDGSIIKLENSLKNCIFEDNQIHTGPIIRKEAPYGNYTIDQRRQILF